MRSYNVIGLMSGTSMDGLDVSYVRYTKSNENDWDFEILFTESFSYETQFINELKNAIKLDVPNVLQLDKKIGRLYSLLVNQFIDKHKLNKKEIDAIASHGQTIFHQPENGFTYQIGCGTTLSYITGIKVINDFRTKDVVAGGQGAPLVPIGDFKLFNNFAESFLNIGGISNISFVKNNEIIAFDICPGNLPLNKLVESKGLTYDKNGQISKTGKLEVELLDKLNDLDFYIQQPPKSLGTEWLECYFYPNIIFDTNIENQLFTVTEHIAIQIANVLNEQELTSVLVTGGGAKNSFLIERIQFYFKGKVIIPSNELIDFKEAIIFGFLGVLYLENETNTLSSVTGASRNVVGGILHTPN